MRILLLALAALLGGCTMPWKDSVGVTSDASLTLAGVDRVNPISMDTTGAVLFLNQKQPDGKVATMIIGQPSIVHERGLAGVVVEQAAGPFTGGWFYVAGQRARRPDQVSIGNVTGATLQGGSGGSVSATATGGAGGVGGVSSASASGGSAQTGGIGIANTAQGGTGGYANANAQQSQGQGMQQTQGQGQQQGQGFTTSSMPNNGYSY